MFSVYIEFQISYMFQLTYAYVTYRERMRQGEINKGFDVLRERIPHPVLSKGRCEKLRKIDILHVAISYIRALENILESGEAGINEFANSLYSVVSPTCSLATAAGLSTQVHDVKADDPGPSTPSTPDHASPGDTSSSIHSPIKPTFHPNESEQSPPGPIRPEKRRQKVLFQNRTSCNSR
jgi:hypothetical protein